MHDTEKERELSRRLQLICWHGDKNVIDDVTSAAEPQEQKEQGMINICTAGGGEARGGWNWSTHPPAPPTHPTLPLARGAHTTFKLTPHHSFTCITLRGPLISLCIWARASKCHPRARHYHSLYVRSGVGVRNNEKDQVSTNPSRGMRTESALQKAKCVAPSDACFRI
jgi:hypothetical protein